MAWSALSAVVMSTSVGLLLDRGMKVHALVTAPKPERRPRMRVPSTMRRAKVAAAMEGVARAAGSGTWDRAKRYSATGGMLRKTRRVIKRQRHRGAKTRMVAMRMVREILQCSRRVLDVKISRAWVISRTNIVQLSVNDSAKIERASIEWGNSLGVLALVGVGRVAFGVERACKSEYKLRRRYFRQAKNKTPLSCSSDD